MVILETTIDYSGYSDYWSGHGHVFESEDLVACCEFSIPVNYSETVGEIIDRIAEDIDNWNWYNVNDAEDFDEIMEQITDKDIEESIRAQIQEGVKDEERFFDEDIIENDEDDIFQELPMVIGWIHVYRK
jgi:hypothetical protein